VTAPVDQAATYQAQVAQSRASVLAYLGALFARLTSWRDADAAAFAEQAAPIVTGAQQHTATLTAAYLQAAIAAGGAGVGRIDPTAFTDLTMRGVPATEVYRRPFTQIWTDLSRGKPIEQAVTSAAARLTQLASTDVQLAKTHASRAVFSSAGDRVVGYRRVLVGASSCALCLIASTQRYHRGELLPIHPACDCGVAPIFGDQDPGQGVHTGMVDAGATPASVTARGVSIYAPEQVGNAGDLLLDIHDAVARDLGAQYVDSGARGPLDYRKVLVTHDHGELGPVLAVAGQAFTGPADIR
jgi:hypothetical protein